jgi:hypothetical protein
MMKKIKEKRETSIDTAQHSKQKKEKRGTKMGMIPVGQETKLEKKRRREDGIGKQIR